MKRKSMSIMLCFAVSVTMLINPQTVFAQGPAKMQLACQAESLSAAEVLEYSELSAQAKSSNLLTVQGGKDDAATSAVLGIFGALVVLGFILAIGANAA